MTSSEESLLRGCARILDLWIDAFGEGDESVGLLRRVGEGADVSDEDLTLLRKRLLAAAELAQASPAGWHSDPEESRRRWVTLLQSVPAGWFQAEEQDGDEKWLIHGMAPLATPELFWLYPDSMRSEQLS